MADVRIYWREHTANWAYQFAGGRAFYWNRSAKCRVELLRGDRMWMVHRESGFATRRQQSAPTQTDFNDERFEKCQKAPKFKELECTRICA